MTDSSKGFLGRLHRRDLLKAGASSALITLLPGVQQSALAGDSDKHIHSGVQVGNSGSIVRAAIHPAIGVARVGNSQDEYFWGPEIPGGLPIASGEYKDDQGKMKRQAARFRIFGLDASGKVVRELTENEADIAWTVHLANQKASWYDFETALDLPEAIPNRRRNSAYRGSRREALNIDPGPRSVAGLHQRATFNSGRFLDERVYLGEIRTDEDGRLLVLGGRGRSFSPTAAPLTTYANNDGWIDDTSDGPVTARVRLGSVELPVDPAWVVVGPPNYAPALAADCSTLYDVISQTMIDTGWLTPSPEVSFLSDIFPIFHRLADLQWVNQGVLDRYGWESPEEFMSLEYLARLADPSPENADFRQALFARFRNPDYATLESGVDMLPPFYGDAISLPPETPRAYHALQPFQYAKLLSWAAGDFVIGTAGPIATQLEDLPIEVQAAALDRAALEACLGNAFHPGCEVTWTMRIASMYAAPFRLRHASIPNPGHNKAPRRGNDKAQRRGNGKPRERDYGELLTPSAALSPQGPLSGNWPGSITRWMAVPWQTDTASCRSGYRYGDTPVDPYLPAFWAARVPNDVMPQESYERVIDESLPLEQRSQAFFERAKFLRNIESPELLRERSTRPEAFQKIVDEWYRLGLVTEQPGPGAPEFPAVFKVETDNDFPW